MDIWMDAFVDSMKLLPFLFLTYLFIEWYEHVSNPNLYTRLISLRRYGPLFGALIGCIPQCGFSVMAASLFGERVISAGTLVAVFISTSDEALPILIGHPEAMDTLGYILLLKVGIAILAGYLIDRFWKSPLESKQITAMGCQCGEAHESIWIAALKHTATIFLFLFVINLGLSFVIDMIGTEALSSLLLSGSILQPIMAAVIGFLPNCAASVLLTQLYLIDSISFGSLLAGLISSAGIGILMLFKGNPRFRENMRILLLVFLIGSVSGVVFQLIG